MAKSQPTFQVVRTQGAADPHAWSPVMLFILPSQLDFVISTTGPRHPRDDEAQSSLLQTRMGALTSRHRAPALLEMYTFILLAKFFPTEPEMQEE